MVQTCVVEIKDQFFILFFMFLSLTDPLKWMKIRFSREPVAHTVQILCEGVFIILGIYLGNQVTNVGQDSTGCQVNLPVRWFDQLLV